MTKLKPQPNKKHMDDETLGMQFRLAIEDIQTERKFDDVNRVVI